MKRHVALLSLLVAVAGAASVANAQSIPPTDGVVRAVARARALLDAGAGLDARALLDSLVNAQPTANADLAEALFWRGALAANISDAERDWKRLLIDVPLADRGADALVRLVELEELRGRTENARVYADRLAKDYPSRAPRAADTAKPAPPPATQPPARHTTPPANNPPATTPPTNTPPATRATPPSGARFSVQLAAYNTLAEAEAMVKRLATRSIDARVDGTEKPFRVRTGYYNTRADAAAAMAALKQRGFDGFIAEITP